MLEEKFIQNPMNERDLIALKFFEKVCFRNEIIRTQIKRLNKKEREILLETTDFSTKWERYAYTRLMNLSPGEKLSMKKLINEIEITYGFTFKKWHKNSLYRVRTRVYNKRRNRKKRL